MTFQEAFAGIAEYICSENKDLSEFLENLSIAKESEIPDNKESKRLLLVEFLIRPLIDEEEFKVLYTGETENEPVSPVKLFLFCLAREVCHYSSDKALVNDLNYNVQLRNALGLEEGEKVFCRKTVSRFRSRIRAYKERTKIDLLEKVIASIMNQLHS